ncbi:hypothetical protein J437_LFUL015747 [Ladona fulva]|uniref:Uncharacterized protein n=1 Tax=Ladona fulva TaxID=123851 RepID=A0A8K0KNL5_LADFU|nr:hypothetical protein J437_LFUL015747 [Ladona fulva]
MNQLEEDINYLQNWYLKQQKPIKANNSIREIGSHLKVCYREEIYTKKSFCRPRSYSREGDAGNFNRYEMGCLIKKKSIFPAPQFLLHTNILLPYIILGNETFRLDKNIMISYCKRQILENSQKRNFNYQLSKESI